MADKSVCQWIKAACAFREDKKTVLISWFKISLLEYVWTCDPQKDSKPYQNVGKPLEKDWAGSSAGISDQIAFTFSADVWQADLALEGEEENKAALLLQLQLKIIPRCGFLRGKTAT